MTQKLKLATLVAAAVLLTACSDNDNNSNTDAQTRSVDAVLAGLDVLGDDFVYQG